MIDFAVDENGVVLDYEPEFSSPEWVLNELQVHGNVKLRRVFTFKKSDLVRAPASLEDEMRDPVLRFRFAERNQGYFHIPGRILGINNDVYIDESISLERRLFVAARNIGIFRRIAKVKGDEEDIVIGGARDGAIPTDVFRELLDRFPSSGELDRYASARVETIVGEFFDSMKSERENYEAYLSKRKSCVNERPLSQDALLQSEIDKFKYVHDTIQEWLASSESYTERDWQKMIIKIILLILPKYVSVLTNVKIVDFYTDPRKRKQRYIDICLVDAGGNIDVIEIKKPFDDSVLATRMYRDNSIPTRQLSGSIMQAEKYLFHLSKWGVSGERELSTRYASELPAGMRIRVTNPKAIIILGRDLQSNKKKTSIERQNFDLEIIKRKYANMIDILTYDDLLRRLSNIITSLSQRKSR